MAVENDVMNVEAVQERLDGFAFPPCGAVFGSSHADGGPVKEVSRRLALLGQNGFA